ncbi:MAG: alpha-galactosidase [Clostridia bacterium]|nr:alpha-galactosidase [Clostridia bacterium]
MIRPSFSFKYNGVPFDALEKQILPTETGYKVVLADGLCVECKADFHEKYGVTHWVNYWSNPTDHPSGQISDLYDCDITVPFEPDPPVTRKNRQATWEPETFRVIKTVGANVKEDDLSTTAVRLWEGQETESHCAYGRSGFENFPFFDLVRKDKGVLVAVGWTGQWQARFFRSHDACRVVFGIQHANFYMKPGESFRTASATVLEYSDGQENAHNAWRRYIKDVISPVGKPGRAATPPFSGLFWGGIPSAEMVKRWEGIVREELPLDTCWIDAGWYEPLRSMTTATQSADWPQVGTWQINEFYHPDRYKNLISFLKEHGKKFLVWFEPERMRKSVVIWTKYLKRTDEDKDDNVLIALNDDQVLEEVTKKIGDVVEELELDWYRQDSNIMLLEYWLHEDEENRSGITEIKYITNLYRFWDNLLARFPHLMIDNCAGGGHRIDIEMLSRSVPLWRSDYQCMWDCLPEANQMQNTCAAWWMPWSGIGYGPKLGDTYSFRSAYTGGIAVRTWEHVDPEWNFENAVVDYDWARKYFNEYLEIRRYFGEDFYALIPNSKENTSWNAQQYHDPEDQSGIILAFRRARSPFAVLSARPRGFLPEATYEFTDRDTGESFVRSGKELLEQGLELRIDGQRESKLLQYRKV